ncbi:mechanosensitive ion channel domain-containing protein [Oceanicaulis alexandrii]|uniref:mechanosensitive ion channel family protein n=1 Tax=Oceanicaulis alexandrii TaxID=153233 RepID=UPI0035CFE8B1
MTQAPDSSASNALNAVEDNVQGVVEQGRTAVTELLAWIAEDTQSVTLALAITLAVTITALLIKWGVSFARQRMDESSLARVMLGTAERLSAMTFLIIGAAIGLSATSSPQSVLDAIWYVLGLVLIIQVAAILRGLAVDLVQRRALQRADSRSAVWNGIAIIKWAISTFIWSAAFLVLLDNAGVDITALIAGLGIGGIAIGLAAQGLFSDLFAGISILFDKPFKRNDLIEFGECLGTVSKIGLKTTRLRSLSGEEIVIRNTNLLDMTIRNFQRLEERRWLFQIGVTYQTAADQLEQIPDWIKTIIDETDQARFERAHFCRFADSAMEFEIVCHAQSLDYAVYMDVRHAVNLALVRKFADEGVEFAYPTRTLMLARDDGSVVAPAATLQTQERGDQ